MRHYAAHGVLCLIASVALMAGLARADVVLDETKVIGLPSVAAPSKYSFTASTAQALTLTLTDLKTPAAFATLQVAVTLGGALVGSAVVDPSTHAATVAIPAAAGAYTVFVVGTPDATQGIGSFGVCVAPAGSAANCVAAYSFSGNIQAPATTSSAGTSTLNTNIASTDAGVYTVTVTDDSFPVALQSIGGGISQGSTPISALSTGTTQVTLAAATNYQLLLAAVADTVVPAGLYSVQIADPSGKPIFARTLPVGTLGASTILNNTVAQGLNLKLTDYAYPAPLASVGVAVTQGSALLAPLTAPGTLTNFPAAAGTIEVWRYALAGAQPGVYGVDLSVNQSSAASLFSTTQVVNPAATTANTAYAFVATLPSAGTYNLVVSDFQFPSILKSLSATVAQNGAVLPQGSTGDFTAAQGVAIVLVDAQPPESSGTQSTQSANGIFGVTVQTSGASPQILLDQTQAVGGVFNSETVNLGVSGSYTATLADLGLPAGQGFPTIFQNLAVVVSQGSQVLGKIYGGGSFPFTVTPGQYVLTFVATPDPAQSYGLYTVHVASTAPTVTFSASAASVVAGTAVTLTWSSQNATACTAGGDSGWTGPQTTSGTLAVAIGASETLTLSCTGPGGSASQSVNVAVTAAPAKSGGGGALDTTTLLMLTGIWAMILWSRRRRAATARA